LGSSNIRRRSSGASSIGALPIPDPRTWPDEIRARFRNAAGECGPLDISIFDYGQVAACYLADAITCAAMLEVDPSEWHTERGYPVFCFHPERIGEIQHRLGVCGYTVHVLSPEEHRKQPRKRGAVVSIASAREKERIESE